MTKSLSIIVSVYNEQDGLFQFWQSISKILLELKDYQWRLIFVNDGSEDDSSEILKKISDESIKDNVLVEVIEFSRNFGHEAAMIAGIDHTEDDILICMDSDLQHPPEYIVEMLEQYQKGSEIVLMNRVKRHDKIGFSSFSSKVL